MSQIRRVLDLRTAPGDEFVKLAAAAATLSVSKVTMRRMIAAGYLPAWRIAGSGEIRLRTSDVLACLTPVPAAWNDYLVGGPMIREVDVAATEPAETVVVVPSPETPEEPVPAILEPLDPQQAVTPSLAREYVGEWSGNDDAADGSSTADQEADDDTEEATSPVVVAPGEVRSGVAAYGQPEAGWHR